MASMSVPQKLYALGQEIGRDGNVAFKPGQHGAYRGGGGGHQQMAPSQGSGMEGVGKVAGSLIGKGIQSYMGSSGPFTAESAAPGLQAQSQTMAADMGLGPAAMPSAQSMGFGPQGAAAAAESPGMMQGILAMFGGGA